MKKRWVKIIFIPSFAEKVFEHAHPVYVKAGCLNLELPERDENGDPKIISYPLIHVFSFSRAHLPHDGASPREKE